MYKRQLPLRQRGALEAAAGKNVNEATQVELMIRESQAGNMGGEVRLATDGGSAMGQLLPQGIVCLLYTSRCV